MILYPIVIFPETHCFFIGGIDCMSIINPCCPCDNNACNIHQVCTGKQVGVQG
jgi:hypothetical protein